MSHRNVLLISEDYLKTESFLDDNVSGKYLLTAIKMAQDIELQSIIGTNLLHSIQKKVFDNVIELEDNWRYKDLLDNYIQPFLLYQVLSEIVIPISYKMSNFGVMQSSDEKDYAVDNKQINLVKKFYFDKANVYKERLQNWLIYNRTEFPELLTFDFPKDVYPNLYSSSGCGIWLGSYRGKVMPDSRYSNRGLDLPSKKR